MHPCCCILASIVLAAAAPSLAAQCERQKLEGSADDDLDRFGEDLHIDGTLMVVGGIGGSAGGGDPGRAYVYRFSGGAWYEEAILARASGAGGDHFGESVAIEGATAVVGAPEEDGGSGAVYVFEQVAGLWTEVARLSDPNDQANVAERFGRSVAYAAGVVLVGAPGDASIASGAGAAYLFEKPVTGWASTSAANARLLAGDGDADDDFGCDVSFGDDVLAIGACKKEGAGGEAGAVYVFVKPAAGWADMTHTAKLTNGEADGHLGFSVAMENDLVLAGAPTTAVGGVTQGAAFLFAMPDTGWADLTAEEWRFDTTDPGPAGGPELGYDVAIEDDWLLLGAPSSTVNGNLGVVDAWRFDALADAWVFEWKTDGSCSDAPTDNSDRFGDSIGIDGLFAVVAAPGDDSRGMTDAGCAYSIAFDEPSASFVTFGAGPLSLTGSVVGPSDADVALVTTGAPPNTPIGFLILAFTPDDAGTPAGPFVLHVAPPWFITFAGSYDANGTLTIEGEIPCEAPIGVQAFFQTFAIGPGTRLHSNGLDLTVIP